MRCYRTASIFAAMFAIVATVPAGAGEFTGSGLPPGLTSDPRGTEINAAVVLTQNTSSTIVGGASVSCNNGLAHTDNSYMRRFDLDGAHGITASFSITRVDFGVELAFSSGGVQPLSVRLYTIPNASPLTFANLGAPIATFPIALADQSFTIFQLPVAAAVTNPLADDLVVEVFSPDGTSAGNLFFIGSNGAGQSATTYLAAPDCGVAQPTPTGVFGFPNMHTYMAVIGEEQPVPVEVATWGAVKALYR